MLEIAVVLGLVPDTAKAFSKDYKWLYWSKNKWGNMLYQMLSELAEIGFLEYDDEEQRYRTNPEFEIVPPPPKTD